MPSVNGFVVNELHVFESLQMSVFSINYVRFRTLSLFSCTQDVFIPQKEGDTDRLFER